MMHVPQSWMLQVLQMTVQRHEATFGVLETDVRRRVRPGVKGQPPQPSQRTTPPRRSAGREWAARLRAPTGRPGADGAGGGCKETHAVVVRWVP